uniref:Uncharacterized protein n=1 Tax=Wuchereria bancrofti TaxID=6293 RepID=A0A1I8EUX2_WUCBA
MIWRGRSSTWLKTEVQGDGATVAMEIKWCHYLGSNRVERLQLRNSTEATTTRHTHLCLAQFQNTFASQFSQRSNFTTEDDTISLEDDLVQSIFQWSCGLVPGLACLWIGWLVCGCWRNCLRRYHDFIRFCHLSSGSFHNFFPSQIADKYRQNETVCLAN